MLRVEQIGTAKHSHTAAPSGTSKVATPLVSSDVAGSSIARVSTEEADGGASPATMEQSTLLIVGTIVAVYSEEVYKHKISHQLF